MRVARLLRGRIERQHVLLVGVVVMVALAGCAGAGNGDGTESPANNTTQTPTPTTDDTTSDDGPQPDGNVTETNATEFTFGESLDSELTPADELDVSSEEVAANATRTIEDVETYRFSSTVTSTRQANNLEQTQRVESETAIDREQLELHSTQRISAGGQNVTQENYIVNGTFYQHSEQFAVQYDSEWIKQNVSENLSEQFSQMDELNIHKRMLENGSVTLEGAQEVDGQRAYRLRINVSEDSFAEIYGIENTSDADVQMVATVWVSAETGELLRSEGQSTLTTEQRGQTATVHITYVDTFEYTDVDITLPEEAATAVDAEEIRR